MEQTPEFQAKCSRDFVYFCEKVLDLEMTPYHREIASIPINPLENRYLCFILPRGHSKTSIFSIAYPLWRLVGQRDIEICLVSSSIDQSRKIFAKVQYILENNPFFKHLLPTDRQTWNMGMIRTSNHNLFYTKPFNSTAKGIHPNYMIMDDLLREEESDIEQSKKIFWSTLFPAGQAIRCQYIVVGTPISFADLYADIKKSDIWKYFRRPAVEIDAKGNWVKALWPERFSLDYLRSLQSSMGQSMFQREYFCQPATEGDVLIPREILLNAFDENLELSSEIKGTTYIGADFAMSTAATGDYNAFIVIDDVPNHSHKKQTDKGEIEIKDPIFVRHITHYKGPVGQTEKLIELQEKYKRAKIIADNSNVGVKFVNELQDNACYVEPQDFQPAQRNKLLMNMRTLFEKNRIVIPGGKESEYIVSKLQRELSGMRLVRNPTTGHISWKSNLEHDDCLKEGTMVKTDRGYKPIEDIKMGDWVLTHKNRFRKVVNFIKKSFKGDFYSFRFNGNLSLDLSYNHPLYAAPFKFKKGEGVTYRKRNWVLPEKWKKKYRCVSLIERFSENKLRVFNEKDFYKNSRYATSIKLKSICLDKSFAEFLGRFLADGHCSKSVKRNQYVLSIAFNADDLNGVFKFSNYLMTKGIKCRLEADNKNGVSLVFSSKLLWHVMSQCYDKNREKILPSFYRKLGKDLEYVLEQWLAGDGWFNSKRDETIGVTTSKALALDMRDIAWSLGKYALIQKCKRHRYGKKTKDQYWVTIKKLLIRKNYLVPGVSLHGTNKQITSFEFGAYAKTIKKYRFSGFVYNLQVEEDESFVADGFVVHNCVMALAMAVKDVSNPRTASQDIVFLA